MAGVEALGPKQRRFVKMFAEFVLWVYDQGYELTDGEAWRPPEQAAINARKGTGVKNSLHIIRLARDVNLFKNGVLQTTTEAHLPLGIEWERRGGTWGGRFGDGNHYSLAHNGSK